MLSLIRGPRPAGLLGACLAALAACEAQADPAPPYAVLLEQAQASAPRLAESRAGVAQAEGLARQADARPNPTVSLAVENFAGSGPFRDWDAAETTASVEQTLELGGKRPARAAAGRAEVAAARALAARSRAEFAFDLSRAYAEAEAADLRARYAVEALELTREDARIADALVRAGKEAELRSVQSRAAAHAARAAVEEARAARATAFGRLAALAGSPVPYTSLAESLLDRAGPGAPPTAPDALASPAYLAAAADREAAVRRVRMEQSRAAPDVTVSLGVRRFAGDDATAMVGGVSAPLPLFDRNRGAVSAAQAAVRAADARLDAARLDAQAEAASAVARAQAAGARLEASREGEDAAGEAYRLSRIGYEAGKLPLAELLNVRRALAEARAQALNARLERLSAEAAIARLSGVAPFGGQP